MTTHHIPPTRAAVLGANGYLGRHLVHFLRIEGHTVQAYDIQDGPADPGVSYRRLDVADASSWAAFDDTVDVVFFFAGLTGTHQGFDQAQRYLAVNEGGLLHLLERIRAAGRPGKIIFPSTRLVYQGSDASLPEEAPKEARTIYAVNKLACEHYLAAYHNAFGIPYAVFRICVPYGNVLSDDYSYGTIGFFLRMARAGKPITLFGDGSQRRTFTHVQDLGRQVIGAGLDPVCRCACLNVAGEDYSLREVADLIARRYRVEVLCREWPPADWRLESGSTVFDATAISRYVGPAPKVTLAEWVAAL